MTKSSPVVSDTEKGTSSSKMLYATSPLVPISLSLAAITDIGFVKETFSNTDTRKAVEPNTGALSLTSRRDILTVVVLLRGGEPWSLASTERVYTGCSSRSSRPAFTTVISPDVAAMANTPPVLPLEMLYLILALFSESLSEAITPPTVVPSAASSEMLNIYSWFEK